VSQRTQLFIDTLNLNLPSGFEGRSNAIAHETVRQLSDLSVAQSQQIATLNVPNIKLYGGEANSVIARRIVRAIQKQINAPQVNGTSVASLNKRGHGHVD